MGLKSDPPLSETADLTEAVDKLRLEIERLNGLVRKALERFGSV